MKSEIFWGKGWKTLVLFPTKIWISNKKSLQIFSAFVNYLKISNGAIIQTHTIELKKKLEETDKDLLVYTITELRQRFNSQSKEIYTSIPINNLWENTKVIVPKIGDKYKLIELSKRNAKYMQFDKIKKKERLKAKSSDKNRSNNEKFL